MVRGSALASVDPPFLILSLFIYSSEGSAGSRAALSTSSQNSIQFVTYVNRRALAGSEALTPGFINSEGHYVNTNINNKCVAGQNCT